MLPDRTDAVHAAREPGLSDLERVTRIDGRCTELVPVLVEPPEVEARVLIVATCPMEGAQLEVDTDMDLGTPRLSRH